MRNPPFHRPAALADRNCRSGSALVSVLLALALLSLLGTNALLTSGLEQTIAGNYRKQVLAFNIAEAGMDVSVARLRNNLVWRGDLPTPEAPYGTAGTLSAPPLAGSYTVTLWDSRNDGQGLFDSLLSPDHVRIRSMGSAAGSVQGVECLVRLEPGPDSSADSPYVAVVTQGQDTTPGGHGVNGWDNDGNRIDQPAPNAMVRTDTDLPTVNQEALRAFADIRLPSLTDEIPGQTGFWRDAPLNTRPFITHVTGNMSVSGNKTLYGIFFVEGSSVVLGGQVRVVGVIYAPNITQPLVIHGGGNSWDQPVMGQVLAGEGGVRASGNHADVQLVTQYVDAFNRYGGPRVDVIRLPGTWRQF